jgi:GTP-binding protein
METRGEQAHIEFTIPARGLIGLRTRLMNSTSGQAIMHHTFYDYQPARGGIPARLNGVMVSTETGRATPFAMDNLQERGVMFIPAGEQVYEGQVVAEHCRDNDLPVNICREKKLTNFRAAGADKAVILKPPRQFTLELALEYIEEDELVEVTPNAIRLRKLYLKENDRKRQARQAQ